MNDEKQISSYEDEYEYEDEEETTFFSKKTNILIKGTLIIGSAIALGILGKKSYETGLEISNSIFSKSRAEKDYEEWVELIDDLTISSSRDLSRRIFNEVYINVGEDALYNEFNQQLMAVTSKEELGSIVEEYLQVYITRENKDLEEDKVTFDKKGNIYYNGQRLELDADAVCVLGNVFEDLNGSASFEDTVKSVIITELYKTEKSDGKQLVLEPLKRDLGY